MSRVTTTLALLLLLGLGAGAASAQVCCEDLVEDGQGSWAPRADEPPAPEAAPQPASGGEEGKKPEGEEKKKEPDRWLAVTGGDVHTVTGPVLRGATVLAKNGKVVALGERVQVPDGAEVLDARGLRVYPGLVAFDTSGIVGSPPEDATDVYGMGMQIALASGITTVGQGPTVAKLTWGTLEGHLLANDAWTRLEVGTGQALAGLRGELEKVRAYLRERRAYELAKGRGEKVDEPDRRWIRGRAAQLEQLLTGRARALIAATTRAELITVADLAQDFGFRGVVVGAQEAWTLAPRLGRAGLAVVLAPRSRRDPDPRLDRESGWSIEAAALLHQAGVPVAIVSANRSVGLGGLGGNDLATLNLEAAYAVRGGLPDAAAVESITIVPARLLGVDDRVGSIEVGKDCDLLLTDRDVLHYEMLARYTVVNGRVAYDKSKEHLLRAVRHSRDEAGPEVVPQLWPRRPGEAEPEMPPGER